MSKQQMFNKDEKGEPAPLQRAVVKKNAAIQQNNANSLLIDVLNRADVWRGETRSPLGIGADGIQCIDTGYAALNEQLVCRGWPLGGVIEILYDAVGSGEWQLVLPALTHIMSTSLQSLKRRNTHLSGSGCVVLMSPPHLPYAPALSQAGLCLSQLLVLSPSSAEDLQWSAEQVLRSDCRSALLLWEGQKPLQYRQLRKLQLAVLGSRHLLFVFRHVSMLQQPSPAVLRVQISAQQQGILLALVKQRGSSRHATVWLDAPGSWQTLPSLSTMPVPRPFPRLLQGKHRG